ncbi:MAG: hypothetical protein AAGB93_00560 [Planctomycetota bacterium]
MPTVFEISVNPAGGEDYTSLSAAYAAVDTVVGSTNLVTADAFVYINCTGTLTERLVLDEGYVTDATRRIVIRAASGQKHTGTIGTGATIAPNSGTGHVVQVGDSYVTIQGLEIHQRGASSASSDEGIRVLSGVQGLIVEQNIVWGGSSARTDGDGIYAGNYSVGTTSPIVVRGNLIVGWDRCGVHYQQFSGGGGSLTQDWDIVGNTFVGCIDGAIGLRDQRSGSTPTVRIYNNLAFACGADVVETNSSAAVFTVEGGGNVSDRISASTSFASCPTGDDLASTIDISADGVAYAATANTTPGVGDWAILTDVDSTNNYENVDARLIDIADNDVLDLGVGPSANALIPTEDILGVARSGATCDPGAFQITGVSSGSGTLSPDGTSSAEASGTASLSGSLSPTGTPSAEASGTATLSGAGSLAPSGTPSSEASGAAQLKATVQAAGTPSAEASGAASLSGAGSISAAGTPSEETSGTPRVTGQLQAAGTPSAEASGSASVAADGVLTPTGTPATEASGAATLSANVAATGTPSAESSGSATVQQSSVLRPGGTPSEEASGAAQLVALLLPSGTASDERSGSPILVRANTLEALGTPSSERSGTPTIGDWWDLPMPDRAARPGSRLEYFQRTRLLAELAVRLGLGGDG